MKRNEIVAYFRAANERTGRGGDGRRPKRSTRTNREALTVHPRIDARTAAYIGRGRSRVEGSSMRAAVSGDQSVASLHADIVGDALDGAVATPIRWYVGEYDGEPLLRAFRQGRPSMACRSQVQAFRLSRAHREQRESKRFCRDSHTSFRRPQSPARSGLTSPRRPERGSAAFNSEQVGDPGGDQHHAAAPRRNLRGGRGRGA